MSEAAYSGCSYGCLLVAGFCTMALWGAGTVQLYLYYNNHSTDKWWMRIHVFLLYALDTAHQGYLLASLYTYFVVDFATHGEASMDFFARPLLNMSILAAVISVLAKSVFVTRIWSLSGENLILTGTVAILVGGQFVASAVYCTLSTFHIAGEKRAFGCSGGLAVNSAIVFVDIVIGCVSAFLLYSHRSKVGQTDLIVNRLVLYTVNTGLATSAVALTALITLIILPETLLFWTFSLIIPKWCLNSALASLNSQQKSSINLNSRKVFPMGESGARCAGRGFFASRVRPPADKTIRIRVDTVHVVTRTEPDGHVSEFVDGID